MKFKILISVVTVLMVLSSCSHSIHRSYDKLPPADNQTEITILRYVDIPNEIATEIASVKLNDSGFSTSCNELDAIKILLSEAESLGADFIVISEEIRPDGWSSCYRCTAEFYVYSNNHVYTMDPYYNNFSLENRVKVDRKNQAGLIIGTIVGSVVGILLFSLIM